MALHTTLLRRVLAPTMLVCALLAAVPAGAADTRCRGYEVDFLGTPGDDVVDVAAGDASDANGDGVIVISTLQGDDTVYGSAGIEVVCLGAGHDWFTGRGGTDLAVGGAGNDDLTGGPHDDRLLGGPDDDTVDGGGGDDVVKGGPGDDQLVGDQGSDRLVGGDGHDVLRGLDGDDTVRGGPGDDEMFGGDGADRVVGGDGADVGYGNGGDDAVRGSGGDDVLNGGDGHDRVLGGSGYDQVFAGLSSGARDSIGVNRGGSDFDVCRGGHRSVGCEADPGPRDAEEWSSLINEVFLRWGIKREAKVWRAVAIVDCESNGDPFAVNPWSGTTGLFQHRPLYWQARVDRVIQHHSDVEPDFPADASPFHPEHSTIVAALLLWESIPGNWPLYYGDDGHPDGVWGHWNGCGPSFDWWG